MKGSRAKVIEINGVPPDPRGRVDILILRCGELLTRGLERALTSRGVPVGNLWDGSDGVKEALTRFCDDQGLTGKNVLSPVSVAERAGLLKRKAGRR